MRVRPHPLETIQRGRGMSASGRRYLVLPALLLAIVLASTAGSVPLAFGSASSGIEITGIIAGTSGLSIDLYEWDGNTYTEVDDGVFSAGTVTFTKSGSNYVAPSQPVELTAGNLYFMVGGAGTVFDLYATATGGSTGNITPSGYVFKVNGSDLSDGNRTFTFGQYYKLGLEASYVYNSPTEPVMSTISVALTAQDQGSTVVNNNGNHVEIEIAPQTAVDEFINMNGATVNPGDTHPSFESNGGTYYFVENTGREDGNTSVYISDGDNTTSLSQNLGGNADNFKVDLNIPEGVEFCIQVRINGTVATNDITIELMYDGKEYHNNPSFPNSADNNKDWYFFPPAGAYQTEPGSSYAYFEKDRDINNVLWMTHSGGGITLSLLGYSKDSSIDVQIVFKGN